MKKWNFYYLCRAKATFGLCKPRFFNYPNNMKRINRIACLLLLSLLSLGQSRAQQADNSFLHTIEKGQSLYSIASMYGVTVQDIVQLNPGSDQKIVTGRTLRIPRKGTPRAGEETFHTIAAGETLYRLTVKYGVTAQQICAANPGLSAQNFRIGQVIRIPASESTPATGSGVAATEQKPNGTTQAKPQGVESRCREMHRVKKKETVFSISRLYGISQEQLIAANPELKGENKLKKGSLLCIPYTTPTETARPTEVPTDKQLFNQAAKPNKHYQVIKAALILPFLDVPQTESSRMTEYYEGFLMAVDSLKRTGVSIDLYTYSSGDEKRSIQPLLNREELKQMDIIFGPRHQEHIAPLANFCKKHDIRLVIPFTSKDNAVFSNPMVYQVNTPQSYLYSEVYDHFMRQFAQQQIIFIEAKEGSKEKADFIKGLKEELATRGIATRSVSDEATSEELKQCLSTTKENLFVPTSGSNLTLIKVLPQLVLTVRENPEQRIHLFGYPEWQTYTKDHLDAFFELDTYFYSSFYTNNLLPASIRFTSAYRRWYAKEMDDRYPKYGMLGFDTGFFFLKGMARYGNRFEEQMNQLELVPIQTGFKFTRVNNWGGFINRKVFFVHFTRDYELLKLDFD